MYIILCLSGNRTNFQGHYMPAYPQGSILVTSHGINGISLVYIPCERYSVSFN